MEESLRQLLVTHAPLTALVAQRVHWDEITQGTARPCIVMFSVGETPGYHMQGRDRLKSHRVQIDCQSESISGKLALARVVETLLSGYRGTVAGTEFRGIFKLMQRDRVDRQDNGASLKIRQQDFEIWSRPTS